MAPSTVEDSAEGAGGGPESLGSLVRVVGSSIFTITFEGGVDGWAKVASLRGLPQRHLIGQIAPVSRHDETTTPAGGGACIITPGIAVAHLKRELRRYSG
jgi:hypothetical protein